MAKQTNVSCNSKDDQQKYLALVRLDYDQGSWFMAKTPQEAASRAVALCLSDWTGVYKFKKGGALTANVFDVEDMNYGEGWYRRSVDGVLVNDTTKEPLKWVCDIDVAI